MTPLAVVIHIGNGLVLACGEFDMATAPMLEAALHEAIAAQAPSIMLDLGAVTFIDASAIGALARARVDADKHELNFAIRGAHGIVKDLLHLTGLLHLSVDSPTAFSAFRPGTTSLPAAHPSREPRHCSSKTSPQPHSPDGNRPMAHSRRG